MSYDFFRSKSILPSFNQRARRTLVSDSNPSNKYQSALPEILTRYLSAESATRYYTNIGIGIPIWKRSLAGSAWVLGSDGEIQPNPMTQASIFRPDGTFCCGFRLWKLESGFCYTTYTYINGGLRRTTTFARADDFKNSLLCRRHLLHHQSLLLQVSRRSLLVGRCTVMWCVFDAILRFFAICCSLQAGHTMRERGKITKTRCTTSIATTTTTPNRTVRITFNEFVYLWSRNCNPTTIRVWRLAAAVDGD